MEILSSESAYEVFFDAQGIKEDAYIIACHLDERHGGAVLVSFDSVRALKQMLTQVYPFLEGFYEPDDESDDDQIELWLKEIKNQIDAFISEEDKEINEVDKIISYCNKEVNPAFCIDWIGTFNQLLSDGHSFPKYVRARYKGKDSLIEKDSTENFLAFLNSNRESIIWDYSQ